MIADDVAEAVDVTEAEENTTAEGISKPETLSGIQKACLKFCITLLSQSITCKGYDSPLVCALAVLGALGCTFSPICINAACRVNSVKVTCWGLEIHAPDRWLVLQLLLQVARRHMRRCPLTGA
jgi:hypothetical protein